MSTVTVVLLALFGFYAAGIAVYILLENRRPQVTLAWILILLNFPVIGLVIYLLFGREPRAFSRERRLVQQDLGQGLTQTLSHLLSQQDQALAELEGKAGPHERLGKLVRTNPHSILVVHNRLELLQDANQKYPRLIQDVKNARHSIHMQYFIWAADPFTEELKAILIGKARENVDVRILYDPAGSFFYLNRKYVREMRAGGVRMVPFSPLYRLHTIGYRNHRKIAVIDGIIGYTGGLNIGQEHLDGGKYHDSWRDTHVRVMGEAATVLQAVFTVDWHNAVGENMLSPGDFPPVSDESARLPVHITVSGPDSQWHGIRQLYFAMIVSARHHIFLQSPFLILNESLTEALNAAALSGIDVRIMLGAWGTGFEPPYWASNTYIREVVAAGVRVFLYTNGYFHPKTLSIDSEICSVGSANLDMRSCSIDYELNMVIYDKELATRLEQQFTSDLDDCTEFSLEEYADRSVFSRLRDAGARLFSPLL